MADKIIKLVDGWLVCACGRKLARIDEKGIKIICRGTPHTGKHYSIIVPSQILESECQCEPE